MIELSDSLSQLQRQNQELMSAPSDSTSSLLDHDINLITVLHLKLVRSIIILEALTVENESTLVGRESLPRAVGVHELLKLCRPLDLEEDLRTILCLHLDVDVLGVGACSTCGLSCVGHMIVS